MNRNTIDEFSALPSRNPRETTDSTQIPARRPENLRQSTLGVAIGEFAALNNEFKTFSRLINIGELTRAVRALNARLVNCKTGKEAIETYKAFTMDIDINFNLLN